MSLFVLDFESYKGKDGEMVVKELSVVPVSGGRIRTWTLKPPYPWFALPQDVRATNRWIYHHMHGIHWSLGKNQYCRLTELLNMVLPSDAVVYVKGFEKAQFVAYMVDRRVVVELDSIGCPKAEEIDCVTPGCSNHATFHCSKVKVAKFAYWCSRRLAGNNFHQLVEAYGQMDIN